MTTAKQKPRKIDQLPETLEGMPETSTQEVKPESNPFTSQDWRMLLYAWAGLGVRILLVAGAAFSAWQYLEAREEKRVERTLQLVELWERSEYQEAQQAIAARLEALNAKYAGLLGADASAADRAVYAERLGIEAMTQEGGDMPLPEFRQQFDRMLYFLNRMAYCVDGNLCSRHMVDGYFGDFALSFWDYFRGHVAQERKSTPNFAAPLEAYIARLPPTAK